MPIRSYEKDYVVQMFITIEMNFDQVTIARTGYTTLDVLSDVVTFLVCFSLTDGAQVTLVLL